jgi:hypothetical protein
MIYCCRLSLGCFTIFQAKRMKKFYLLSFVLSVSLGAFAQSSKIIYSTGPAGSFTTGASSNTTRTDNTIQAIPFGQRGYAVFNLGTNLPVGASVTGVDLGFTITSATGGGGAANIIRAYNGNLSLVTTPSTLYTDMGTPTATQVYNTSWGTVPTNILLLAASSANVATYVQSCFSGGSATGYVSMIWSAGGSGYSYNIVGETGAASTVGSYAPYIDVYYNCPGLTIAATATPSVVCAGAPFTLNGAGSATAVSYSWAGPGGFSSTLQNPSIPTGIAATGIYTVTVMNAAGCDAKATVTVTLDTTPSAAITAATAVAFCPGGSATLNAPSSMSSYQWYDNGIAVAGATNLSYTANGNGSYQVKVIDAAGCTATTPVAVNTVLLNSPLAISPADPVYLCVGDNGTMTVNTNNVGAPIAFQWQKDGANITGANTSSYTTSTSGAYNVLMNVAASGCNAYSDTVHVTISPYPTPSVSVSGNVFSTGSYTTYQWFLNTVAIAGATNASVVATANGSYRVRVSNISGCTGFSGSYPFYTAGAGQLAVPGVVISPNPSTGMIHIEAPMAVKAVIMGMEGKVVMEQLNAKDVDISRLPAGLYFVAAYDNEGTRVSIQQIVKE